MEGRTRSASPLGGDPSSISSVPVESRRALLKGPLPARFFSRTERRGALSSFFLFFVATSSFSYRAPWQSPLSQQRPCTRHPPSFFNFFSPRRSHHVQMRFLCEQRPPPQPPYRSPFHRLFSPYGLAALGFPLEDSG